LSGKEEFCPKKNIFASFLTPVDQITIKDIDEELDHISSIRGVTYESIFSVSGTSSSYQEAKPTAVEFDPKHFLNLFSALPTFELTTQIPLVESLI
jgi:hypothetical protein